MPISAAEIEIGEKKLFRLKIREETFISKPGLQLGILSRVEIMKINCRVKITNDKDTFRIKQFAQISILLGIFFIENMLNY